MAQAAAPALTMRITRSSGHTRAAASRALSRSRARKRAKSPVARSVAKRLQAQARRVKERMSVVRDSRGGGSPYIQNIPHKLRRDQEFERRFAATRHVSTPKGLHLRAQGKRSATLG